VTQPPGRGLAFLVLLAAWLDVQERRVREVVDVTSRPLGVLHGVLCDICHLPAHTDGLAGELDLFGLCIQRVRLPVQDSVVLVNQVILMHLRYVVVIALPLA